MLDGESICILDLLTIYHFLSQLGRRFGTTIVAPTRRHQEIFYRSRNRATGIGFGEECSPCYKSDVDWIGRLNIIGKPISWPFLFGLKTSKHSVPENKNAAMVSIKVFYIAAMVHPVVRRRIKNIFYRGRQPLD